jgi:hypothetical protein
VATGRFPAERLHDAGADHVLPTLQSSFPV